MTMSDKSLAPYTEAVLHEIQRKGNIAPMAVLHQTTPNSQLSLKGYDIPPNTVLVSMIGDIMRDPNYFPEPDLFDPERHLVMDNHSGRLIFQPDPRVVPFGIGKRRCLGENLAKTTLYKFFTAIVQKYEIVSGQTQPIEDVPDAAHCDKGRKYVLKLQKKFLQNVCSTR